MIVITVKALCEVLSHRLAAPRVFPFRGSSHRRETPTCSTGRPGPLQPQALLFRDHEAGRGRNTKWLPDTKPSHAVANALGRDRLILVEAELRSNHPSVCPHDGVWHTSSRPEAPRRPCLVISSPIAQETSYLQAHPGSPSEANG